MAKKNITEETSERAPMTEKELQRQEKEEWKNSKEFFVRLNSNFAIYLFQYKDKIPVPIKDLDKLPKSIQEKLQK